MKTLLIAVCLLSPTLSPAAGRRPPVVLRAKVYRAARDPKELVGFAKSLGLNTLFVGEELATSLPFREECQKAGLQYFLIIRIFNDPEAATDDPTTISIDREGRQGRRDGDVMISPAREDFRRLKRERIRAAIERLQPDGVTLDHFRYFIYWEGVDPRTGPVDFPAFSFDRALVEDFIRATGLRLKAFPGTASSLSSLQLLKIRAVRASCEQTKILPDQINLGRKPFERLSRSDQVGIFR